MHGRVVVLIGQALDLEALIGRFERLSILKDDHGGDNIRPGQVGDVVGFHPVRGIRQVEHIGQHAERAGAALRLGGDALGFFAGVFLRQLDQTDVVAALRHADKDLFVQFLLQKSRYLTFLPLLSNLKREPPKSWTCCGRMRGEFGRTI